MLIHADDGGHFRLGGGGDQVSAAVFAGRQMGDGQCVALVRLVAELPHTWRWRQGEAARLCPPDTAIATFNSQGRYSNALDGSSHAAILIQAEPGGLRVWDQWVGQPVHQRLIRFRRGESRPVDDGDAYYSIYIGEDQANA